MAKELYILLFSFILFFGAAYITSPTEKDIKKCIEKTGYPKERCEFEMKR